MAKVDATGRAKRRDDHHVRLYSWLTNSPAWQACSGNEIKGLVYLASFDFGDNNGRIHMSVRRLSEGIGVDEKTARKVLAGLEEKGLIACTEKGSFNAKCSPASQWRLTWKSWPDRSQGPTNEYRRWKPSEKSRGENFPSAEGEIPESALEAPSAEGEIPPAPEPKSQKTAKRNSGKTPTLTLAIGEGADGNSFQGNLSPQIVDGPISARKAARA